MPNRFTGRIRRGEIASIEELKSEFKALAKLAHPDLAGPGASGAEFALLRSEYEAALRDFERHRFGLGSGRGRAAGRGPAWAAAAAEAHANGSGNPARRQASDRRSLYAALEALRRRGFPKAPRHEKERLRYEYARFVLLAVLGARDGALEALFRGFEESLAGNEPFCSEEALELLDSILAWHKSGNAHERRGIELEYARVALAREKGGERRGPATEVAGHAGPGPLLAFIEALVRDLEKGPALAAAKKSREGSAGVAGSARPAQ